jgi:hypothetical protein
MELLYTNQSGASLALKPAKPYFLQRIDGTGGIRNAVNTFRAPEQDGAFFISSALDMRNITLEGTLVASTAAEAHELQRRFLQIFSPKQRGTLVYKGRQISCVVEEAAFVVTTRERTPGFFVSLLCPSPFFESLAEIREELALWLPVFSFVLEIPPSGIEFGYRQPSQILEIENAGDVPCGCTIIFRALGTITNPELLNMDTGEYIRLLTTMSAGDEYRVFTHFAGKRVVKIVGGAEQNAFNLLDTGSAFFQLSPGANTLRYNADSNMGQLECSLRFRPRFLSA